MSLSPECPVHGFAGGAGGVDAKDGAAVFRCKIEMDGILRTLEVAALQRWKVLPDVFKVIKARGQMPRVEAIAAKRGRLRSLRYQGLKLSKLVVDHFGLAPFCLFHLIQDGPHCLRLGYG